MHRQNKVPTDEIYRKQDICKKMFHIKIIKFQRMHQTTIHLFDVKRKYGGALKVNFKIFYGNLHCRSVFL